MDEKAAAAIIKWIGVAVKLRRAKDANEGVTLSAEEVRSLAEMLHVLKSGATTTRRK